MSILDISNWTINEINNSIDTFKDTSLTDIGMVNCDIESINIVGGITTATLWIDEDIGIDGYTGIAPLKIYKEDKIEIKLNSPLFEGDTIEIVDGKLCHVHKYGKIELDGSENWKLGSVEDHDKYYRFYFTPSSAIINSKIDGNIISNKFPYGNDRMSSYDKEGIGTQTNRSINIKILASRLNTLDNEGFKQWVSENPIVAICELKECEYENITPLQSEIVLKTFEECNMNIVTNLPIKTNVSYRTNVPSISTLSTRATELAESDNVIHNLMNIIDDEVDE